MHPADPRLRRLAWFALAGALIALAGAIFIWAPRGPLPAEAPFVRVEAELRSGGSLGSEVGTDVVLSADGSRLVFVSLDAAGTAHLNAQRLDQSSASELPGTEGARAPFLSPDGKWVGFWAAGVLKKTSIDGGSPVPLCEAPDLLGASWGEDGHIVAALNRGTLSIVPAAGGTPTVILDLAGESLAPAWPQILTPGRLVLFTAIGAGGADAARLELLSLHDGARTVLFTGGTYGRLLANGDLTYVNQGALFAVPFDLEQRTLRGTAVPVLDDVAYSPTFGFAQVDVARNGTLVYRRQPGFTVMSIDSSGGAQPLLSRPGPYVFPKLSPNGQQLAISGVDSGASLTTVHDLTPSKPAQQTVSHEPPQVSYLDAGRPRARPGRLGWSGIRSVGGGEGPAAPPPELTTPRALVVRAGRQTGLSSTRRDHGLRPVDRAALGCRRDTDRRHPRSISADAALRSLPVVLARWEVVGVRIERVRLVAGVRAGVSQHGVQAGPDLRCRRAHPALVPEWPRRVLSNRRPADDGGRVYRYSRIPCVR